MKRSLTLPICTFFLAGTPLLFSQPPASSEGPTAKTETLEIKDEAESEKVKLDPKGDLPSAVAPESLSEEDLNTQEEIPGTEHLSKDDMVAIRTDLNEAANYMKADRRVEALARLNNVERIVGQPVHLVENLRGAIYTKMRDFASAREHFAKSAELDKNAFHPRFNLAEIDFVEKKYDAARSGFSSLVLELHKMAEEETDPIKKQVKENDAKITGALMKFKIFICDLQTKTVEDEDKRVNEFNKFDDNVPAYYFAKAAACFSKEKKEEAEDWMNSARNIYAPAVCEIYIDSFVEMGWLQSLQ